MHEINLSIQHYIYTSKKTLKTEVENTVHGCDIYETGSVLEFESAVPKLLNLSIAAFKKICQNIQYTTVMYD